MQQGLARTWRIDHHGQRERVAVHSTGRDYNSATLRKSQYLKLRRALEVAADVLIRSDVLIRDIPIEVPRVNAGPCAG